MNNNLSRVKISDIAQRAGVSTGTVDRVIHNRGEVSKKTRDKVLRILEELNYQPDILASTLASKKVFRIAALIPEAGTTNLFWNAPLAGLQEAWREIKHFGVSLDTFFFKHDDVLSFEKQFDRIIGIEPDGLLVSPIFADQAKKRLFTLKDLDIPVVFINSNIEDQQNIAFVGQDTRQSGMVAARLLDYSLNSGESISIINFISETGGNHHILSREEGFRYYFEPTTSNRQINTTNIYTQEEQKIEEVLTKAIGTDSPRAITKGVFVTNSRVFKVANYLKKHNIQNVILIGYDLLECNIDYLRNNYIDFLISQNPWEQGYKSLMALFNSRIMKKEIVKNQFLPIDIITKENIDYYLNN
ncbi:LacI family DNA-binding transcriptional regulator [Perlabentimonas gracilis]|uniref:LacI family DNA-binding transcriptional regulator n=1 Tax=Perlabentimonas gracilis TaxID=2715279 RepID=UPI00140AF635|nr:LacI family DNA-binding transcriptional regulator [Perlabentimonas gracilis]NHB68647.1 LacI family transcriptional regulator [Perlabentimonas gracilis]